MCAAEPVLISPERVERKSTRQRVLKEGKIVTSDMQRVIDVNLRDLSVTGALVLISPSVILPQSFSLLIVSERRLYPAISRWRRGETMGVEFVGEPRLTALRIGKPH